MIRDLSANPPPDVEFFFADNSDDRAIADIAMTAITDTRICYLPPLDHTPSVRSGSRSQRGDGYRLRPLRCAYLGSVTALSRNRA